MTIRRRISRRPSIVLSLVMIAGVGLVAGCGADQATAPTRLTLGLTAWPGRLPWQVAKEKRLFTKHGVDVEMKYYSNYTSSLLAPETGTDPRHLDYQAAQIADFIPGTGMIQSRPTLTGLLDERFVMAVPG